MYATLTELESTAWARAFRANCSSQYEEALRLAIDPELAVTVSPSNETVYAIAPIALPDFWFEAFDTSRKAIQFCYSMGWRIKT